MGRIGILIGILNLVFLKIYSQEIKSIKVEQITDTAQVVEDSKKAVPEKKAGKNEYNKVLAEALRLQLRADSAARITRDLRILARELTEDSLKKQNANEINRNDKVAKGLQRLADEKFEEAKSLRSQVEPVRADSTVILKREINGIKIYQYRPDTVLPASSTSFVPAAENSQVNNSIPEIIRKSDQFMVSDKPAYSGLNPIPQGLIQDTGLIYRVQLGVFSKLKTNDSFGGISPVAYEQLPGGMLKYYAGLFYGFNGVTKALESIRDNGFPDAFVVAFYNGKSISVEKAKEIEFAGFKL